MTISQIYQQYQIMPQLQLHQLRVAAVGQTICQHVDLDVDQDSVIKACLLHDMGNILKFDLARFPEYLEPEGLEFWSKALTDFKDRYGDDEHKASLSIARELGVEPRIIELIDAMAFEPQVTVAEDDWEAKICDYADMRAAPQSIVSLEERVKDFEERYKNRYPTPQDVKKRSELTKNSKKIEAQIQKVANIDLNSISEDSLHDTIVALENYPIS